MGQLERGVEVGVQEQLSLPSREEDDLVGFTQLVLAAVSESQVDSECTPCPFKIAGEVANECGYIFGDREKSEIIRELLKAAKQGTDCDYSLNTLCGLVHQLKVVETVANHDDLRDNLLVTLSQNGQKDTAQVLANQLVSINTDFKKLPELLTVLPENFSEEAWDRIGQTLGLGPTKNPSNITEKIRTAYKNLTGTGSNSSKRGDTGRSTEVFLSDEVAKDVLFRVLSLPIEKFEREGISQRWNKTEQILISVERLVSNWEQGERRTEKITDPSCVDTRKNAIRNVPEFQSLSEKIKAEILSYANLVGGGIAFKIRGLRTKFQDGYKEEQLVLERLRDSGAINHRDIYCAGPGSITDQFGRDIAIGKRPNPYESYLYVDIKSSINGVNDKVSENAQISGKLNIPTCLQALQSNGDKFRIVLRAIPLCFRENGDKTQKIIDNPIQLIFEAERQAKFHLEKLLDPHLTARP